jgi:hypothetical protein
VNNVVADALSRIFDNTAGGESEAGYVALLQDLPLVYSSLEDHQKQDPFCMDLRERLSKDPAAESKLELHRGLLCYRHTRVAKRRYCVPSTLKAMLLKYFHDSPLSGHLGAFKTLNRISSNFYWPNMRQEIFKYVRRCDLCQRAKPAQTIRVGLHSATPPSRPLERVFIDFMGPMVRTKKGNLAICHFGWLL